MRYLHILRHAKTEPHGMKADFDRKLIEKGWKQCEALAKYFEEHLPELHTLCSTSKRTRETIKYISDKAPQLQEKLGKVSYLDSLYHAELKQLIRLVETQAAERVLLVGHNEGISELASHFSGEFVQLSTGEYIVLQFDTDNWEATAAGMASIVERFDP